MTATVATRPPPNMVRGFGSLQEALKVVPTNQWLNQFAVKCGIQLDNSIEQQRNTAISTLLQEPHRVVVGMIEGSPMEPLQDESIPDTQSERPSMHTLRNLETLFNVKTTLAWRTLSTEALCNIGVGRGEQVVLGYFQVPHW